MCMSTPQRLLLFRDVVAQAASAWRRNLDISCLNQYSHQVPNVTSLLPHPPPYSGPPAEPIWAPTVVLL